MTTTKTASLLTVALILTLIGACSSAPVLLAKNAVVPDGVDLSGQWQLRGGRGGMSTPEMGERIESLVRRNRSRSRAKGDVPVRVFLENGEKLKFTQTRYGIFISYDRSVVEEYTFGENRLVEIGPIEARRVSGWEGDAFSVETLDTRRNRLLESWRYREDEDVLVRQVTILENDKETFSDRQTFDRIE